MKKSIFSLSTLLILFALIFQSCLQDKCDGVREYVQYDPVYLTVDQIRKTVTLEAPRALENPGKLYIYNNILFINEQGIGIHIYDNNDPSNPIDLGFYPIVGNFDIAIKDNILYADNVMDIISLDITNISSPILVHREEDAFEMYPWNDLYLGYYLRSNVVEVFDCNQNAFNDGFFRGNNLFLESSIDQVVFDANTTSEVTNTGSVGVGGSTARFTIVGDYLYNVDQSNLMTWSIADQLEKVNTHHVGWGIETLFPYEDNLFIGSATGMYIYDNSNPESIFLLSTFEHARACDPVVVDGNTAYVTLRNGSACQSFINQLDVIDISNITNPTLIKTYPMTNPHGLAIRDNLLYLCEGDYGLKIYDATDSEKIDKNQLANLESIKTTDVIALPNSTLLVIGSDGFYQYDVSDVENPKLLSHILVEGE